MTYLVQFPTAVNKKNQEAVYVHSGGCNGNISLPIEEAEKFLVAFKRQLAEAKRTKKLWDWRLAYQERLTPDQNRELLVMMCATGATKDGRRLTERQFVAECDEKNKNRKENA